jgi:hypothetical protein
LYLSKIIYKIHFNYQFCGKAQPSDFTLDVFAADYFYLFIKSGQRKIQNASKKHCKSHYSRFKPPIHTRYVNFIITKLNYHIFELNIFLMQRYKENLNPSSKDKNKTQTFSKFC